jgi:hypothetical protein
MMLFYVSVGSGLVFCVFLIVVVVLSITLMQNLPMLLKSRLRWFELSEVKNARPAGW